MCLCAYSGRPQNAASRTSTFACWRVRKRRVHVGKRRILLTPKQISSRTKRWRERVVPGARNARWGRRNDSGSNSRVGSYLRRVRARVYRKLESLCKLVACKLGWALPLTTSKVRGRSVSTSSCRYSRRIAFIVVACASFQHVTSRTTSYSSRWRSARRSGFGAMSCSSATV